MGVKRGWYNSYRHKEIDMMSWIQILDEAICISFHANVQGKDMNPSLISSAMDKMLHIGLRPGQAVKRRNAPV